MFNLETTRRIEQLAARLREARRVTVLTGAGVSAASGVPTFRGAGGLWRNFRASDLATPEAFARDPAMVWDWYQMRREQIASCRPNRAHEVLASWTIRSEGSHVVTQNIDDLHLVAGTRDLVRLHGSIWELSCWKNCGGRPRRWRDERMPLPGSLPTCRHCGGLARPAVVWFGEILDPDDLRRASAAAACDVFLAAGTSAIVYPAAGFIAEAQARGAFTAEINVEDTAASSSVDLAIQAPVAEALDAVESLVVGS